MSDPYEVIERLTDPAERRRIADCSYAFVREAHTYRHRSAALYAMVSKS